MTHAKVIKCDGNRTGPSVGRCERIMEPGISDHGWLEDSYYPMGGGDHKTIHLCELCKMPLVKFLESIGRDVSKL